MTAPAPGASAAPARKDQAGLETTDSKATPAPGADEESKQPAGDVRALHDQARAKAAAGDCASALALRDRLYRVDPDYLERNVKNDPALTGCLKRAKKAASKPVAHQEAETKPSAPAANEPAPSR
jgi:hypothetical protein